MNDNLNNFYKELQKYKNDTKKRCINCKRDVGTKFSTESWESKRVFKIQCGDTENPCDLNETFSIKQNKNNYGELVELKRTLDNTHIEILQLKSKLVHEIISEEVYTESFKKLEEKYKTLMMEYGSIQKNMLSENQHYRNMSNELKLKIDENKKIDERHIRINHYLENIHELKNEVAKYNDYIIEKNTFQLQKKIIT